MPIYNLNNRRYNIPDDVVNDFERDNPDATIAYNADGNIYDIPVSKKQGFLQKFPNATLHDDLPQAEGQVVNNTISGGVGTQEEADSLFELNAARFNEKDPIKRAALDMQYNQFENSLKEKQNQQLRDHLEESGEIKRLQEVQGKAQLEIDKASFFDRFFNANTRAAVAARDVAEEALETYSEANQKNDGWFDKNVGGVLRGFFDKVGDLRTWDFGASGISSAVALKDASEKLERGEALTPTEQNMLDAYGLSAAVQAAYQDKVGTAYRVGGSLPESLAFGASLAINPAGGVGKKIAETAAKAAVKKYGTGLVSKLAKGAARVGGDIVEMGVATAVPGAGRVVEDYYNRLNGQSTFDIDNNGIIRYGGQVEQEEADDAIWKAFGSQFIENYSEAMGNYFAPMGTMLSNLTSKGLKAGGLGKLAEAVSDISSSQWSKGLQRFKDAVKFDGLVGEYLEEVAGNFMNAATVGDMNFNSPEDPRSVFNPDTNIETFLSCALLSGTMYAVEAPITLYNKHTAKKNLRNADSAASSLLGNRWEDLRNQMDSASPEHLAQILTGVQNAGDLSNEQKQAVKEYASRLMQSQGFNARNVQNAQETTAETNEANNAYNEGSENDAPQYVFKANRDKVKAGNALKAVDENVASVIDTALETGESVEVFINSLDENVAPLARDYYNKSLRMRGVIDGVMDRAEDAIAEEEKVIRSVTDPSTGMYTEISRLVTNPQTGEREAQPGYVVGWIGEGENRMPTFLPEGVENIPENRVPLKPTEFDAASIERLPMDDVLSLNAEMIRERAKKDLNDKASMAEQVYNYVPMNQDQVIGTDGQVLTITDVTPDGIVYINEQGKPNQMSLDEWKGLMQAQLDAQEAAQAEAVKVEESNQSIVEGLEAKPMEDGTGRVMQPKGVQGNEVVYDITDGNGTVLEEGSMDAAEYNGVSEESKVSGQAVDSVGQERTEAPVIPTKEDGSVDFVSYGKEGTFKALGEKYGEKMPNKVAVTAKALADDLAKAQKKLDKAIEDYDNAPIGREEKAEKARDKAQQEFDAIKLEADFWAEMDTEIKDAQFRRASMLNPQAETETSSEPMNADEFVAQQLSAGNIVLNKEDYKKETGYGDTEENAMNGGAAKIFGENGMTIQEAGERLMEMDRENGTNFFDQSDSNAGRDALISLLGSVKSRKELNQYIASNRAEQAKKESEGLRNELERSVMDANYASLEDYVLQMEADEMENPFSDVNADEILAIFAEAVEEYNNYLNPQENGQGTTEESIEGNGELLSEEQSSDTGGTEVRQESERNGEGAAEESKTADAATEVELTQQEGETPLQFAERAAEENRRRPLRKRAEEWSKALGVDVIFVERLEDVDSQVAYFALMDGEKVSGWYEGMTGKVYFYMPNLDDISEVDKTYIHEVVAHKGLKEMLGKERFDELCDKVWDMMPSLEKAKFIRYPGVKGNTRAAADEYIAHLAEKENLTPEEMTMWDRVVKAFRDIFETALNAIIGKVKLTDEDISNLIKASYANLKSGAEGGADGRNDKRESGEDELVNSTRFRTTKEEQSIIDKAKSDGTYMLAPNGEPTNLTEKQWAQVRTEAFKKWFGDWENDPANASKVVDENGEPLVMVHNSTTSGITEFKPNVGNAIFFADKVAQKYVSGFERGENDYEVFLNIKNPHTESYEAAFIDEDEGIDGVFVTAEVDEGVGHAAIVKNPNQIKSATDNVGTFDEGNNDLRFRVVKDKNELVAVHNISEENLRKVLEVGGLIMPSIAITKADMGHEGYGEISLLFDKETINPTDRRNKVYGGDAWTPRFPQMVPKLNDKVSSKVYKKIKELIGDRVLSENYSLSAELHPDNIERTISDRGLEGYYGKEWMKLAYLLDNGKKIKVPMKMKDYGDMSETILEMAKERGLKVSDIQDGGFEFYQNNADFVAAVKKVVDERKLSSFPEEQRNEIRKLLGEKEMKFNYFDTLISAARRMEYDLEHGGLKKILDRAALRESIEKKVKTNNADYNKWVDNLFDGIVEKYGIRNDRDWYTPSGYLRPWGQLYDDATPANILKHMLAENEQGGSGGFFDSNIMGASADTYESIEEIREKGKKRLRRLEEGEYDEWSNSVSERMSDICYDFLSAKQRNEIGASIDAKIAITNAVAKDKSAKGIYKEMKREYPGFTMEHAKRTEEIVKEIQDFAIGYFEAKPRRIVPLSEVRKAIVPKKTSEDILEGLKNNGIEVATYKNGDEAARARLIKKESNDIRFRFIGERGARNLDKAEEATTRLDNLAVAREMEAAEKDAKAIKMATGWERGADGLWRYEVDDNIDFELRRPKRAELKKAYEEANEKYYKLEMRVPSRTPKNATEEEKQRIKELRKELAKLRKGMNKAFDAYYDYSAESATLGEFLGKDNQLFKEYPELADYDVSFIRDSKKLAEGLKGSFTPEYKVIWVDDARPKGDIKSTLVHEIQHAIQGIEGFAQGGTPAAFASAKYQAEEWKANFNEFINRYGFEDWSKNLPIEDWMKYGKEYKGQFGGLHRAFIDNAVEDEDVKKTLTKELDYVKAAYDKFYQIAGGMDPAYKFKDANEWYRSLSGEVESRNVQQRMGMTDEQRRNTLAESTEDVAREDQIFLKDGIESGMRFRISEKGKQIQAEVDKFSSKYNSKPVVLVDSAMTDEELEEAVPESSATRTREEISSGYPGGYSRDTDKIYIFVDNQEFDDLGTTMFHENLHPMYNGSTMVEELYNNAKEDKKALIEALSGAYEESEMPNEMFAHMIAKDMVRGDFKFAEKYLSEESRNELFNTLKEFGYDRVEEESIRRRQGNLRSDITLDKESQTSEQVDGGLQEGKAVSPRERKERLGKLFDQVADMGLEGVLENKVYTSMMVDIYKALPEAVRTEIADDAIRLYGGSVAPAVSDYIGVKSKESIIDKIVTIVREALRKVGFDLDLNVNEVRYLAWRSKKPLDRNNLLEVAEDIDMKNRLKVGEYDGTTPDGGGTRFRVANKLKVRDEYEATIKKGGYQAREAVQDAMLSLRKFQELIEKASGKKIRDFENAWMHENRLSSVVQAEIHEMERKFYKPMMDAVKKLMDAANLEQEEVADYLMLKHGIERNREMAVRKALTDDQGKIDRTQLEQWYQEKQNIRNDASLDTWRKKQEAMDNLALMYGADMSRDYSGLTSMFGTDDLADSTQKAYDEVEALENAHSVETESLGKAIKAMTQSSLDKAFESGLMDRKVYNELTNDMYDYYIPLRGFDETTSEEVYAYLDQDRGAFNAPLVRAKGRSSKSDNPIAYLKSIAESGIMQGNRNKMKQSFLNMVMNNPSDLVSVREGVWAIFNPASGEWESATPPTIPNNATPADVEAAMEAWEQQMEQAAQSDPTLVKKVAEAADVPYRVVGNRMNQHQVIVKRLGKSYTLTINGNPRLAMALNGQTNPNNTSNDGKVAAYVSGKIDALNRTLSAWYTTRNPDFVASNFMRDTFYTNTIVRAKEGNAYANKFHKNYAKLLKPGKMINLFRKYENGTLDASNKTEAAFLDFMMNGGETGYSNLKDLEHIKKQIAKELKESKWDNAVTAIKLESLRWKNIEALAEKLDILNRAFENTARFAAYLTSRQEGRSIAKSIFDAKEISVNFNKKGAGGTFFGMTGQTKLGNLGAMVGAGGRAFYVFFNAAIQGTTNLMHVMKVNPKGTSAGVAAVFLMGAVVPMLFAGDDDEKNYYDLPEHVRRNHLIIPGTGDAWVSIPLPIEYRIMYGMGELLTSWRTGHERGSDIARKMLNLTGQALPLNFLEEGFDAFIPSALSPIWQVYNNKSWTGLPIYKDTEFNKDDPEYTKAYKNVDRLMYNFSKSMYEWTFDEENQKARVDLNPAVMESLARGYFGGLATQLSNLGKTWETIAGEREFDWRSIPIGNRVFKSGDERTKEKRITNEYFENMEKLEFLQARERLLKKTINGVEVPEMDKEKAKIDDETMRGSEVYQKYMEFKKLKKTVDKIRKTIKEKGSTPELEKALSKAQEEANKAVR